MISTKKLLYKICEALSVAYVVEQGTDGIWTYRKWSNGTAECWGRGTATLTNYTTAGTWYGYVTDFNFPSGLFIATPTHIYIPTVGTDWSMPGSGMTTDGSKFRVYALSNTSGSKSCVFDMYAIGKWK